MADEEKGKRLLGYAYNYTADIGDGQVFQVTGSLPLDATLEQINAEWDKFYAAGSRQKVKALKVNLEEGISKLKMQIAAWTDNLALLDARTDKGHKLAGNERTQRDQFVVSLKADKAQLEHKEKVLADVLKQLE